MAKKIVPHSRPTLGKKEEAAVLGVLKSGQIAHGGKVREFEEKLARFAGVKGAVCVNSGTSALHLGLLVAGIGQGDAVLLPSFVCSAPMNAVYAAGAEPRLCDIDTDSFNSALGSIEDNKTENAKAVIVPHMFGNPADVEEIEKLGLPVIEDCAHSIGAVYGNKKAGSMGYFSIFSFYATKMICCGEGGAMLSDDENILNAARDLRDYDKKDNYKVRYNYKMTDMQAAMGLAQLEKLPEMIERRKEAAGIYEKAFSGLDATLPKGEFDHIYYRYVIKLKKDVAGIIAKLKEEGVMCERPVFRPLHRYLELRSGFRNTDEAYSVSFSVPIYPSLTAEEQKTVIDGIKRCLG